METYRSAQNELQHVSLQEQREQFILQQTQANQPVGKEKKAKNSVEFFTLAFFRIKSNLDSMSYRPTFLNAFKRS